ncbi:MAG: hypothetical protein J0M30_01340 [Chitinophagales bacterium]|nr:hypothetical protein [Chitinophagales bacterium]
MKRSKIFLLLALSWGMFLVFSCSKNENNSGGLSSNCDEPETYFKYRINGELIECTGSLTKSSKEGSVIRIEQLTGGSATNPNPLLNTSYAVTLHATKNYYYNDEGETLLKIILNTGGLTQQTYSNTTGIRNVVSWYPTKTGFCASCSPTGYVGQQFTVTISKLAGGYADGTFSGTLVKEGTSTQNTITEGEFKNVKVCL